MKIQSKKIVFFGNERLATGVTTALPVLKTLIQSEHEIVGVVIKNTETKSRKIKEDEIITVAIENNIPILMPKDLTKFKPELKKLGADIGVLASYGKIVPEEVINVFPHGIVNIHPSLLPKYRGSTPIESVLLDGSEETGVTLMQLVKEMDAGPILAQEKVNIAPNISKQKLADILNQNGAKLLIKNINDILSKKLKPYPQNNENATYNKQITKLDGAIDWNQRASDIERQIRAYQGWPSSRTVIDGKDVQIIEVEVTTNNGVPGETLVIDKNLFICAGEGAIRVLSLKPAGKNIMSGQEFVLGYLKKSKK